MVTSLSTTLHCFKIIDQVVPFAPTLNKVLGLMWVFHENDSMIDFSLITLRYGHELKAKTVRGNPMYCFQCVMINPEINLP